MATTRNLGQAPVIERPAPPATFDVRKIREDFPILKQKMHGKPLVYLDNAATSQKPQAVIDALVHYYTQYNANIHRGVYLLSERSTQAYEDARVKLQRFLNAADHREIVYVRGSTEGINLVAQTYGRQHIGAGDEILITAMEHHSNIVPWQMLCEEKGCRLRVGPINDRGELMMDEFEKLINDRTRLVSVAHVSNALGTINPVKQIVEMAHARNIPVLVDGAQAAPHMKIDVQALDCDFYAISGHKLFGPTGIGALYGKAKLLESMPPYQGGGDMILSVTFEKTIYNHIPEQVRGGDAQHCGGDWLGRGYRLPHPHRDGEHRFLRTRPADLRHGGDWADSRRAPDRHGAREDRSPLLHAGGNPPARCRHGARPGRHCRAHRPSLRAAGDGALRRARHRARLPGLLQHQAGDQCPGGGPGARQGDVHVIFDCRLSIYD